MFLGGRVIWAIRQAPLQMAKHQAAGAASESEVQGWAYGVGVEEAADLVGPSRAPRLSINPKLVGGVANTLPPARGPAQRRSIYKVAATRVVGFCRNQGGGKKIVDRLIANLTTMFFLQKRREKSIKAYFALFLFIN